MTCRTVELDDEGHAIVCTRGRQHRVATSCEHCADKGVRLCDWKLRPGVTCSMPLCLIHTTAPAPGKDLCPRHAKEWESRQVQAELPL